MNRWLAIFLVVGVLTGGCWWFFANYKRVEFEFTKDAREVVILRNEVEVGRFTENASFWLRRGEFEMRAELENYTILAPIFIVEEWTTIDVDVIFSDTRLAELLTDETSERLEAVFWRNYSELVRDFEVVERRLFLRGDWYGIVLEESGVERGNEPVRVRGIMQRVSGEWSIVGEPEVLLTAATHPEVPRDILRKINRL
ncbi:hypothetical protein FWD07_03280 [Candidatus Saccharibacteria bacterium]|nr:hypothetical protein [Candidatus Saccharibacteria bacterium]